jgi:polyisoprenoid-binding protein YceI
MARRQRLWLVLGVTALVVALGGFLLYRSFFGGEVPPEVSLGQPSATPSDAVPTTPGSTGPSASGAADGEFDGSWAIDTSSGSFAAFTSTFAGYRIDEELGGLGAHTAVGRTPDVSGSMQIEGSSIIAVSVAVDMTTLPSDDDRRDNQLRMRGLETDTFPTATFELTEPIDVATAPTEGETISADATGNLTLHGVTKEVTVPIQAQWTGDQIEVVAKFDVSLADYAIEPPTGFFVLSVADHGTIELHLLFARA